jgi:dihydroneopterin aldolase
VVDRVAFTRIAVRDLVVDADIGIYHHEIGRRQPLVISVRLDVERVDADRIEATVDYQAVVAAAEGLAATRIALIEAFAYRLAVFCLRLPGVSSVDITVDKPGALASGTASVSTRLVHDSGDASQPRAAA